MFACVRMVSMHPHMSGNAVPSAPYRACIVIHFLG